MARNSTKTPKPGKKVKSLVVPLDAELKDQVKNILQELGLNQSQIVLALFKQIARTKKVPLSFDLNDAALATESARQVTTQEAEAIEQGLASGFLTEEQTEVFLKKLNNVVPNPNTISEEDFPSWWAKVKKEMRAGKTK